MALALYHNAVPVEALDEFANMINAHLPDGFVDLAPEEKGTFVAALVALTAFGAVNMPFLRNFSKKLQAASEQFMKTNNKYYQALWQTLNNGASIAAARTHKTRRASLQDAWDSSFDAQHKNDERRWHFRQFMGFQNAMATGAAAAPGLAGVFSGNLSFGGFTQQTFLLGTLMHNLRYLLNIIPETANLKITAKRLSELALMVDKAGDRQSFYQLSGFHEFEYHETKEQGAPALEIKDLRLLHRGQEQHEEAFVRIPHLILDHGDRLYIKGASGCGKTSTLKAICGLWGYGEGNISFPEGQKRVYAEQFVDIPYHMGLADLVRYGSPFEALKTNERDDNGDILEALRHCGLLKQLGLENKTAEELQDILDSPTNKGQHWASTLSGGQRQRLMLARLIYQQPDLIFLDEPTSALDKDEGQRAYFKTLSEHCPDATIIVIMHDDAVIDPRFGFFSKMLEFGSQKGKPPKIVNIRGFEEDKPTLEARL